MKDEKEKFTKLWDSTFNDLGLDRDKYVHKIDLRRLDPIDIPIEDRLIEMTGLIVRNRATKFVHHIIDDPDLMGPHLEEWRDIEGFEDYYQVSSYGRIKSLNRIITMCNNSTRHVNEKILKHSLNDYGYPFVVLRSPGVKIPKTIHRFVGIAFIPNPDNKPQINHIDGDKANNHVSNLEWATASENIQHAFDNGLKVSPKYWKGKSGSDHNCSKKIHQIDVNSGEILKTFDSGNQAAIYCGNKGMIGNISNVCHGKQITAYGYKWRYAEDE